MKVFLHIGMSKAGSTAIQGCLIRNRERLRTGCGVVFPSAGFFRGTHRHILKQTERGESPGPLEQALAEGANQRALVLTSEGFWTLSLREGKIAWLAERLSGLDVTVILYLRRPADYLRSSYRQKFKTGRSPSIKQFLAGADRRLDYPTLVHGWGRHFRLRVRAYEAVRLSIERDFLSAIGAASPDLDASRREHNTTPSDGTLRLIALARQLGGRPCWRALRRRAHRLDPVLRMLPGFDDVALDAFARVQIERWREDGLRGYLPDEEIRALEEPGGAET